MQLSVLDSAVIARVLNAATAAAAVSLHIKDD
jgi:hypothetical protein